MLPGIGGSELILIAVVALIVVGPKDLPKLLRQLGRFVAKMRSMADEFRTSFDDMARQSELDDLRKEVEALRSNNPVSPVIQDIREDMRRIEGEIDERINPVGPSYAKGYEAPSPDEADFAGNFSEGFAGDFSKPNSEDAALVEAPGKKPRKPRAKPAKAETAPEVTVPIVAEAKPKRSRAKKVVS